MKKLIEKYQQPSSTLDWWNQYEHKQVNGKTLYRFIDPQTGQVKWVDPTDSAILKGKRGYAYYNENGNPTGRYTRIEGDPIPAPIYQQDVQLQHLKDKAEADRIAAARTDGLEDLVLPWNWPGYAFNNTVGRAFQYLPENAQKTLAYGRYISPSYWVDRMSGLADEQILNGEGNMFATSTGTTFDFMSAPLVAKGVRNTPYVAAAQKFNQPLRNWGRAKVISRMIDEGAYDVYGGPTPLWKALLTRTKPEEVEDPYLAVFEKYSKTPPPRFYSYNGGYVRPQVRTGVELGAKEPFMQSEIPLYRVKKGVNLKEIPILKRLNMGEDDVLKVYEDFQNGIFKPVSMYGGTGYEFSNGKIVGKPLINSMNSWLEKNPDHPLMVAEREKAARIAAEKEAQILADKKLAATDTNDLFAQNTQELVSDPSYVDYRTFKPEEMEGSPVDKLIELRNRERSGLASGESALSIQDQARALREDHGSVKYPIDWKFVKDNKLEEIVDGLANGTIDWRDLLGEKNIEIKDPEIGYDWETTTPIRKKGQEVSLSTLLKLYTESKYKESTDMMPTYSGSAPILDKYLLPNGNYQQLAKNIDSYGEGWLYGTPDLFAASDYIANLRPMQFNYVVKQLLQKGIDLTPENINYGMSIIDDILNFELNLGFKYGKGIENIGKGLSKSEEAAKAASLLKRLGYVDLSVPLKGRSLVLNFGDAGTRYLENMGVSSMKTPNGKSGPVLKWTPELRNEWTDLQAAYSRFFGQEAPNYGGITQRLMLNPDSKDIVRFDAKKLNFDDISKGLIIQPLNNSQLAQVISDALNKEPTIGSIQRAISNYGRRGLFTHDVYDPFGMSSLGLHENFVRQGSSMKRGGKLIKKHN